MVIDGSDFLCNVSEGGGGVRLNEVDIKLK